MTAKINKFKAGIVRRIFNDYAAGKSPKAIAKQLNAEGIASPTGKGWGQSTINGNRERGTGILNNELYIGRLIWNRLRYTRHYAHLSPEIQQEAEKILSANGVASMNNVM